MATSFLANQSDLNERSRQQMERANSDRRNGIVEPLVAGNGADVDWRRFYGPDELALHGPFMSTECGYVVSMLGNNEPPEQGTQVLVQQTAKGVYGQMVLGQLQQKSATPELVYNTICYNFPDGHFGSVRTHWYDPKWPNSDFITP